MWVAFWIGGDFNRSALNQEVTFITLARNISKNMSSARGLLTRLSVLVHHICIGHVMVIITKFCTI